MGDNFFYSNKYSKRCILGRRTAHVGASRIRGPSGTAATGRQLRGANCRLKLPPYHPTTPIEPDAARLLCGGGGGGRTRRPQQARPPTTLYPSPPALCVRHRRDFPVSFQTLRPPPPPPSSAPTTCLPRVT